ncbi:MAG: NUDIX domain-containing protein [Clostridia bacterium]
MDNIIGIGVGVILLNKNNEILLLLRNSDPKLADSNMHYEGQYTLPAGKIKFGEEFEEAGIRKVKQETNLDVLDIETICLVNDYNEFAHYATIGLLSRNFKGDINLGDSKEQVEYLWSNIENLPKNICKSSIEIINRYKENVFYKRKEI